MFVYRATCPCNRPRPDLGSTPPEEFLTRCLRGAFPVSRRGPAFVVMGSGQCTRRPRSLSQQIQTLPGSVVARLPLSVQAVGCTGHFRVYRLRTSAVRAASAKVTVAAPPCRTTRRRPNDGGGSPWSRRLAFAARALAVNQVSPRHAVAATSPNAIQPSTRLCTSVKPSQNPDRKSTR